MIETKKLKELLDNSSAQIPEILETTTNKNEEMAALLALLSMRLHLLETIAEDTHHPDFDENFRLIRGKMNEVMKLLIEKV